ncbi:EamA family transporter [Gemmatimonas sp.]|uniref:DMT family transporter n=1 Tax=Gemmatimonas sp. TaxID=1962908 RepID=UPI003340C74E
MTAASMSGKSPRRSASTGRVGVWLVVAAAFQWALLGPVARVALAEGVAPLTVAFWRASIAALLFAAHATVTRADALRAGDRASAMALGVVAVAGLYVAYFKSVQLGGAALSAILLYSAPVWVAIGTYLVFRERVRPREAAALLFTLGGVVLVALFPATGNADLQATPAAVAWGLGSGVAYAAYFLLGRSLFGKNAPARVMSWALATGAVVLAPFVQWGAFTWRAWAAIAFLASVATYGAYLSNANGLRLIGPSRASTIATLEPVLAVIAAYFLWGEQLSSVGIVGAVAVIGGVVLAARER